MVETEALALVIEEGAVVAATCVIAVDSAAGTKRAVRLVVGAGNVFHPHSSLVVIPPSSEGDTVVARIGENNSFEEGCRVVLDLGGVSSAEVVGAAGSVIGKFNRFAPLCNVRCGEIGSGNSIGASCRIRMHRIGNGNAFAPLVRLDLVPGEADKKDGCVVRSGPLEEMSVYEVTQDYETPTGVSGVGSGLAPGAEKCSIRFREHRNGTDRNRRELVGVLSLARDAIEKHHALMKS